MSEEEVITRENLQFWSTRLSCDDQHKLATAIAANVGYVLTPEPSYDEPAKPSTEDRLAKLEKIVSTYHPHAWRQT